MDLVVPVVTTLTEPTTDRLTMYTTNWCGYCVRLKSQLKREGIAFTEVNIEEHPEGAALVAKANNGNLTVPTLLFADGTALTNPSVGQVSGKLATLS
jgi:mycoredoxin